MNARIADGETRILSWLKRLLWLGIADFLLISAFEIHHYRVGYWQQFEAAFDELTLAVFNQPITGWWLYAVAFPFVALNFGCHVMMLRGKRGLLVPFFISIVAIALMQFVAGQTVIYRDLWSDILWMTGYFIGGAVCTILFFFLDGVSGNDNSSPFSAFSDLET